MSHLQNLPMMVMQSDLEENYAGLFNLLIEHSIEQNHAVSNDQNQTSKLEFVIIVIMVVFAKNSPFGQPSNEETRRHHRQILPRLPGAGQAFAPVKNRDHQPGWGRRNRQKCAEQYRA